MSRRLSIIMILACAATAADAIKTAHNAALGKSSSQQTTLKAKLGWNGPDTCKRFTNCADCTSKYLPDGKPGGQSRGGSCGWCPHPKISDTNPRGKIKCLGYHQNVKYCNGTPLIDEEMRGQCPLTVKQAEEARLERKNMFVNLQFNEGQVTAELHIDNRETLNSGDLQKEVQAVAFDQTFEATLLCNYLLSADMDDPSSQAWQIEFSRLEDRYDRYGASFHGTYIKEGKLSARYSLVKAAVQELFARQVVDTCEIKMGEVKLDKAKTWDEQGVVDGAELSVTCPPDPCNRPKSDQDICELLQKELVNCQTIEYLRSEDERVIMSRGDPYLNWQNYRNAQVLTFLAKDLPEKQRIALEEATCLNSINNLDKRKQADKLRLGTGFIGSKTRTWTPLGRFDKLDHADIMGAIDSYQAEAGDGRSNNLGGLVTQEAYERMYPGSL